MDDTELLSPPEWQELSRIDQALEQGPGDGPAISTTAQLAQALADFRVAARPGFQDELGQQLRSQISGITPAPSWRASPLSARRRWILTVGTLAFLLLAASMLAFPQARAAVAQWFGLTIQRQTEPYSLIRAVIARAPLSDLPSYEYSVYWVPRARWDLIKKNGFNTPKPDDQISLPNNRQMVVPAYLPQGYEWQDARVGNASLMSLGYPQLISGGGGGGGGARMPEYDRSFETYLVGGDPEDHLLLLAQFHEAGVQGFSVRTFYVIPNVTTATETDVAAGSGQGVGAEPATPTPPPDLLANTRLQVGVIVEPHESTTGLTLAVGTTDIHQTRIGNLAAWWYQGAWNSNGVWVDDKSLTSLVWRTDTDIYQLVTDALPLDELVRVAESARS